MSGRRTLIWALGASLLVHGLLLTLRWTAPEHFERYFQDSPLDVVLVNAHTQAQPEQATLIAQANLAGGGQLQIAARATSPLPPSERQQAGDAAEDSERQLAAMKLQQTQLLAQIKQQLATTTSPATEGQADGQSERESRRQQLSRVLASIEQRMQEENARPEKRYIGPATREESYALYYDALRRRIEARGTQSYPQSGGVKLYGALTMALTLNAQGQVLKAQVLKSSGQPILDRQASSIARSAGPFGPFTPAMRRKADQLVVVSRFEFTRDEGLRATASPAAGGKAKAR